MANVENISIDSLKLTFPLVSVNIINQDILSPKTKIIVSDHTGEIIEETKLKTLMTSIDFNNYSIKVGIVSRYNLQSKTNEDLFEIYLHSKLAEYDYFKAISKNTIDEIYHRLIDKNVFYITYSNFMNAKCNDIDIKQDFTISNDKFSDLTKKMLNEAKPNKNIGKGVKRYPKTHNIQFNRRESSTHANPFLKFYDKQDEALNSTEEKLQFFQYYIKPNQLNDIKRLECTLKKPSEIKKLLNVTDNQLNQLMNVSAETLKNALTYSVNKNLNMRTKIELKTKSKDETIHAIDVMITAYLSLAIHELKLPFEEAKESALQLYPSDKRSSKSALKKKIQNIYELEFKNDERVIKNEEINSLLNQIGWGQSFSTT